jgi:hypothetical protein
MNANQNKGDASRLFYQRPEAGQKRIDLVENLVDGRPRVAWVFPLWGRPEIFRIVLENFFSVAEALQETFQMVAFCVVSPEDPTKWEKEEWFTDAVHSMSVVWVEEDNEFLGRKWNAAFAAANVWCADMVVQMGSDNLISWPYIERAASNIVTGRDLVGIKQCVFFDWESGATGVVQPKKNPFGYGPGRFYSRRLLDLLEWTPYPEKAKRRMEAQIEQNLKRVGFAGSHLHDMVFGPGAGHVNQIVVDLKSYESMNAFSDARKRRIKGREWTDSPKGMGVRMFPDLTWPERFEKYLTRWVDVQDEPTDRRN